MPDMDKENGLPADLKLRSYAALSSTLELERALRETLRILKDVLPADGVFVNFFMKEALTVQFLAHATPEKAERMTANVPVPGVWHERMSYARRGACLLVDDVNDDPLTRDVLSHVLPDVKSFIIMAVMMSGGIWLRSSGIAPDRFIAVFYTGLGASLLTAGIRFGYQFVRAAIAAGEEKTAFQDEKGD